VQGGFLFPSENHCFSLRKDKQDKDRQKRQGQRQARHKDRQKRQKRQGTHFCLSLSCLSFLSCPCLFCLSLSCLSFLREKQCFSEGKKPSVWKRRRRKTCRDEEPPSGRPVGACACAWTPTGRGEEGSSSTHEMLPQPLHPRSAPADLSASRGGLCVTLRSLFYGEGVVLLCGGTLELETSPPHPRTAYMPGHAMAGSCGASRRVHGGWCCKSRVHDGRRAAARAISVGPLFEMAFSPPIA
jgi:hypothetical protein